MIVTAATRNRTLATASKNDLRRTVRWAWICFLHYAGLLRWARRSVAASGVVVLTFHRVLDDKDLARSFSPAGMVLRRSTFESLLKHLQANCETIADFDRPASGGT